MCAYSHLATEGKGAGVRQLPATRAIFPGPWVPQGGGSPSCPLVHAPVAVFFLSCSWSFSSHRSTEVE